MTPTPHELIHQAAAAGVHLWAEGPALRYRGDPETVEALLPKLKAHKPELLALLARMPGPGPEPAPLPDSDPARIPPRRGVCGNLLTDVNC